MIKLADLAARLAQKQSMSQGEAERFLNLMVNVMNEGLRDEKQLKVKGLGTFKVVSVHSRESVDVNTGERIKIEGREKVSFVPEASMRDLVNRPFAQFETVVLRDDVDFDEIDTKYVVEEDAEEHEDENLEDRKEPAPRKAEEPEEISRFSDEIPSEGKSNVNDKNVNDKDKTVVKMKKRENTRKEIYDDSHLFDEYGYYIGPEDDKTPWIMRFFKNKKTLRWLMAIIVALFSCMFLGMCLLYYEMRKRDARIEEFAAEMDRVQSGYKNIDERLAAVREAGAERFYDHERKVDSIKKVMMRDTVDYTEAVRVARIFQDAEIKRKEERLMREEKERKEAEERRRETERREDAKRMNEISNKATLARELEAYNSDARVRTGAYVITGIDRTVKVQKGQTLASISKAWLGAGMECYVEAVNGGIKTVEPGQELKIPSLKVKKYSTKQPWE